MRLRTVPSLSSLPLQRLLHLNVYYSLVYGAVEIAATIYKLIYLSVGDRVALSLPILVAVWCIAEIARLNLGYAGNLREKVRRRQKEHAPQFRPSSLCAEGDNS